MALYPTRDIGFAAMLVEPRVPNRRHELQRGLYLAGLNMAHSLEARLFGAFGHTPTGIIPERNAKGVFASPVGVNVKPLDGSDRRGIRDAGVVQGELRIPEAGIRSYLENEDVSNRTRGLEAAC